MFYSIFLLVIVVSSQTTPYCANVIGNLCVSCVDDYILSEDQKSCTYKRTLGCETINNNKCTSCSDGYKFDFDNQKCVIGDEYCLSTKQLDNNDVVCTYCMSGTTLLDSKKCVNCTSENKGCSQASNSCSDCDVCEYGYYLDNTTCVRIPNCKENDPENVTKCQTCIDMYNYRDDQCMWWNVPNCISYIERGVCATCEYGYTQVGTGCRYVPYCTQFDSNGCTSCAKGYGLNNKNCTKCEKALCTSCYSDYSQCDECADGYTTVNGQCMKCEVNGCKKCVSENPYKCYECNSDNGYKLIEDTKQCYKCPDHCTECSDMINSVHICSECETGYAVFDMKCAACGEGCMTCSGVAQEQCSLCKYGYHLDGVNKKCYKCAENCLSCQAESTDVCEMCAQGYAIDNGKCRKCDSNCISCDSSDYSKCLTCKDGYVLVSDECQTCDESCQTCTSPNDYRACVKCASGFYKDSYNECIKCTKENCNAINKVSIYNIETTCNICSDTCDYKKRDENGYSCGEISFCDVFDTTRKVCVECQRGYYLNADYECKKCSEECLECVNTEKECKEHYKNVENCVFYDVNHKCKTCENEYKMENGVCVKVGDCVTRNDEGVCIVCENQKIVGDDNKYPAEYNGTCSREEHVVNSSQSIFTILLFAVFLII
ncbi:glutamine/asparagine-rich protein pqn-25, putative [Entamoeba invadens IP1]|uniref:Glutamine/asparagine-rich protein pqn-25, putative n=1 Tax=Entamoeba invadens IP1 TaxID=370355 RepID=L7FMV7_ENTIV|nr:glutamine/asparagine-rich protein pqn-25, putative [Entamoeba invadens IP1]ELP90201.1 glutamine/asparagine-rich protein pqn-25, putative [Entamoeba invadens IP1]|eukprot:XP_004256972.1 glutamine/asparagine-rich protein pqn-25, putative [Entamoeba invadens IP1]